MKVKAIGKRLLKAFKENWPTTTILAMVWLILGFLKSFGINTILLYPFHFISGALMGVDGGSFIGGIVGKTILLLLLNSLLKPLILNRQNKKARMKTSFKLFITSVLKKIPNFNDVKQLFTKEPYLLGFNVIGFGLAFLVYPFITGNGQL